LIPSTTFAETAQPVNYLEMYQEVNKTDNVLVALHSTVAMLEVKFNSVNNNVMHVQDAH
jgi:hypothetical protein